jgi:predicted TIM-barrel fold metal-dependent hydrolase
MTATRREFLAAGASAIAGLAHGQSAADVKLIDVHHHVLPDFWKKATSIPNAWGKELSLASMDKNGVATSILSMTAPGVWTGDVEASRTLARQSNDFMAQLAKDHPGRFGVFAAIPLPDTEGSLKEIAYAFDVLKADGIGLITNYNDKWLGDASYAPVFEELNRRKAVVYTHPGGATCCGNLVPAVRPQVAEYPHDTTRAVLSLLFAGAFTKYRDVRFILSHGGGTVPYLAGRIVQMTSQQKDLPKLAPSGVEFELKRLFYEIAANANGPSMAALMELVPLEQILFGTDYPFVQTEATSDGMKKIRLNPAQVRAIARDNAGKLLPRWKS